MTGASLLLSRRALLAAVPAVAWPGTVQIPAERETIREAGLVGTLYTPLRSRNLPAVVSLAGAEGGYWEEPACALAAEGFPTLALATNNVPGRPARISHIPLDYIDSAITWLRERVGPPQGMVALRGWSRGGEAALTLASLSPNVGAVLAYTPRCYVGREQDRQNSFNDPSAGPAWTWRGEPVVGVPLPPEMRPPMAEQHYEDWFGIPVERIKGPIMLISGDADTGLAGTTSNRSCSYAMHRLDLLHSPIRRVHLNYPDAGHDIAGPPPYAGKADGGGTIAGNTAAVADSWPRALNFLRSLTRS